MGYRLFLGATAENNARTGTVTATGGGVGTVTFIRGGLGIITATGGGVATLAQTTARLAAVTATGGGTVTISYLAQSESGGGHRRAFLVQPSPSENTEEEAVLLAILGSRPF